MWLTLTSFKAPQNQGRVLFWNFFEIIDKVTETYSMFLQGALFQSVFFWLLIPTDKMASLIIIMMSLILAMISSWLSYHCAGKSAAVLNVAISLLLFVCLLLF